MLTHHHCGHLTLLRSHISFQQEQMASQVDLKNLSTKEIRFSKKGDYQMMMHCTNRIQGYRHQLHDTNLSLNSETVPDQLYPKTSIL